jgi:hypothetical protein
MPIIRSGPLRGFFAPDYDGGSVVNLLASVIRSRGGRSPHADLRDLPAARLKGASRIVYLLVDGVGARQLATHLRNGGGRRFFHAHPYRRITTVFPATTAAAVTTFATGATPAEHAVLGWFLHLPDLGLVSTILLATTRTGSAVADDELDLGQYLNLPSHIATVPCRKELLSWGSIPYSRYSRAGGRWDTRRSYGTLRGMEREIAAFARRPGRAIAYAYWPEYDSLCHASGCAGRDTKDHLEAIDASLARLVERLKGTGTVLLVTADHGLVDVRPRGRVDLRAVPGFYGCLSVLPSGDARQVHCMVRPARVGRFLQIVRSRLAKVCVCIAGRQFLSSGVLGPGKRHPALEGRVGDYVLIAREGVAFTSPLPHQKVEFNVGNHGGMSEGEVVVPLYVIGAGDES